MRVSIIVPVKNESQPVLENLLYEVTSDRSGVQWEFIIVDDGSEPPLPRNLARVRQSPSQGYGAAIKAGIQSATGDFIVTADGDGQHRFRDVQRLVEFIQEFPECAMVIGNRRLHEDEPLRYVGRKGLNMLASSLAWQWIPDLNSGMRLVRADLLKSYASILCDHFSFTTSLTMALLCDGYRVDWLPIRVMPRTRGRSHVHVLRDGWTTLRYIMLIGLALRTRRLRAWCRPVSRWLHLPQLAGRLVTWWRR